MMYDMLENLVWFGLKYPTPSSIFFIRNIRKVNLGCSRSSAAVISVLSNMLARWSDI